VAVWAGPAGEALAGTGGTTGEGIPSSPPGELFIVAEGRRSFEEPPFVGSLTIGLPPPLFPPDDRLADDLAGTGDEVVSHG
jgi:hypothetical protein